jgi:hypothetical protein
MQPLLLPPPVLPLLLHIVALDVPPPLRRHQRCLSLAALAVIPRLTLTLPLLRTSSSSTPTMKKSEAYLR